MKYSLSTHKDKMAMVIRGLFMELDKYALFWGLMALVLKVAVSDELQNATMSYEGEACAETNCSSAMVFSTTQQPEMNTTEMCSNYSNGWGLQGSEWGCCGNYEGCCTYASLICYFHDAMCRCCDVSEAFCGPSCKPEPDCSRENAGNSNVNNLKHSNITPVADKSEYGNDKHNINGNEGNNGAIETNITEIFDNNILNETKSNEFLNETKIWDINNVTEIYEKNNETKINDNVNETKICDNNNETRREMISFESNTTHITGNETAQVVRSSAVTKHDFLDIEELERTINTTDGYGDIDLELEKLLNQTEAIFNEHDELFGELGSGEDDF